ncbi:MAG: 4'-phosphopantetheinyl transferase superfamily protein [Stenotrophomonas sp.]
MPDDHAPCRRPDTGDAALAVAPAGSRPHHAQPRLMHLRAVPMPAKASALLAARSAPLPGIDARLHLLEYCPSWFDPSLFATVGMACPASIARSVPKRQAEFLFGRLAARTALASLGCADNIEVGIGSARQPLWPAGFIGSITHAGRYAGAVVLPRDTHQGVGIDIEGVVEGDMREALLATALDPAEAMLLHEARCAHWSHDALITAAFSAKESLFKAAFGAVGRFFGFEAARCIGWDRRTGRLHLMLTETLCPTFPQGRICEIGVWRLDHGTVFTCLRC